MGRGGQESSSFLNLATKRHAKLVMHSTRDPDTGFVHHDPFQILGVWQHYCSGLFTAASCDQSVQDDMLSKLSCRLSNIEPASCEGLLSLEKCFSALSGMAQGNMTKCKRLLIGGRMLVLTSCKATSSKLIYSRKRDN